jgi:hypothetical protein
MASTASVKGKIVAIDEKSMATLETKEGTAWLDVSLPKFIYFEVGNELEADELEYWISNGRIVPFFDEDKGSVIINNHFVKWNKCPTKESAPETRNGVRIIGDGVPSYDLPEK